MKKQTISLATFDGDVTVEAEIHGDLAIHPFYERGGTFDRRTHSISHIPTGKCLGWTFTKTNARKFIKALKHEGVSASALYEQSQVDKATVDRRALNCLFTLMFIYDVTRPLPTDNEFTGSEAHS